MRAAVYLKNHERVPDSFAVIHAARERLSSPAQWLDFLYLKGDILHDTEDFGGAVEVYDQILAEEQTDIAFGNKALALWELGKHEDALRHYRQAVEKNADNSIAWRGAGEMSLRLGSHDEAVTCYLQALRIEPTSGRTYCGLGRAYYYAGECVKAYDALWEALKLDPDDKIAARFVKRLEDWAEEE